MAIQPRYFANIWPGSDSSGSRVTALITTPHAATPGSSRGALAGAGVPARSRVGASRTPTRLPLRLADGGHWQRPARGAATRGPWWLSPVALVATLSVEARSSASRAVVRCSGRRQCRCTASAGSRQVGASPPVASRGLPSSGSYRHWWTPPTALRSPLALRRFRSSRPSGGWGRPSPPPRCPIVRPARRPQTDRRGCVARSGCRTSVAGGPARRP